MGSVSYDAICLVLSFGLQMMSRNSAHPRTKEIMATALLFSVRASFNDDELLSMMRRMSVLVGRLETHLEMLSTCQWGYLGLDRGMVKVAKTRTGLCIGDRRKPETGNALLASQFCVLCFVFHIYSNLLIRPSYFTKMHSEWCDEWSTEYIFGLGLGLGLAVGVGMFLKPIAQTPQKFSVTSNQ